MRHYLNISDQISYYSILSTIDIQESQFAEDVTKHFQKQKDAENVMGHLMHLVHGITVALFVKLGLSFYSTGSIALAFSASAIPLGIGLTALFLAAITIQTIRWYGMDQDLIQFNKIRAELQKGDSVTVTFNGHGCTYEIPLKKKKEAELFENEKILSPESAAAFFNEADVEP